MKKVNITEEIRRLHVEEQARKIAEEVKEDLKHGAPQSLKDELSALLEKCNRSETNVISFPAPASWCLAEIELLAAAPKQNIGDLVTQPLICLSKGFSVDIRRVLDSENEVTLYFQPVDDCEHQMEEVFSPYKGQTISLDFVLNSVRLLTASIYVDDTARQAEGEGILINSEVDMKDPVIEINVNVDE